MTVYVPGRYEALNSRRIPGMDSEGFTTLGYARSFLAGYMECALWASIDDRCAECEGKGTIDDEPCAECEGKGWTGSPSGNLDDSFCVDDIPADVRAEMESDCASFIYANRRTLRRTGQTAEQAGHDFWLTRNGHGAGYWDRGLGADGDALTDAAHAFGSAYLAVDQNGKIYSHG